MVLREDPERRSGHSTRPVFSIGQIISIRCEGRANGWLTVITNKMIVERHRTTAVSDASNGPMLAKNWGTAPTASSPIGAINRTQTGQMSRGKVLGR
jgi:hypothetical protein